MKNHARTVFHLSACSRALAAAALALAVGACSDGNSEEHLVPFHELVEQGVTRYLGEYSPMSTTQQGNVVSYHFGEGDGPLEERRPGGDRDKNAARTRGGCPGRTGTGRREKGGTRCCSHRCIP